MLTQTLQTIDVPAFQVATDKPSTVPPFPPFRFYLLGDRLDGDIAIALPYVPSIGMILAIDFDGSTILDARVEQISQCVSTCSQTGATFPGDCYLNLKVLSIDEDGLFDLRELQSRHQG